jgi:sugar-specific transcriptional regulator TrmB
MDIQNKLALLGLNKNEIIIYLFLIQNGKSSVTNVSRETKISRTNCYYILNQLIEKRLVEENNNQKKKMFLPLDPSALVGYGEKMVTEAKKILPDLYGIYSYNKNKPVVSYAETDDELVALLGQISLTPSIHVIGSIDILKLATPHFYSYFISELDKKGNSVIYTKNGNIQHLTIIWGGNTTFITKTEPFTSTTLSNSPLTRTIIGLLGSVPRETNN